MSNYVYTEEQIKHALGLWKLLGNGLSAIRMLKEEDPESWQRLDHSHLHYWARRYLDDPEFAELSREQKRDLHLDWKATSELVLDEAQHRDLSDISLSQLGIMAGIATDKVLDLTEGRRGMNVNISQDNRSQTLVAVLPAQDPRGLPEPPHPPLPLPLAGQEPTPSGPKTSPESTPGLS